jgi:hypothetical protein
LQVIALLTFAAWCTATSIGLALLVLVAWLVRVRREVRAQRERRPWC